MYVHDNCLKSVTVIITVTFIIRVVLRVAAYFTCSVWDSFPRDGRIGGRKGVVSRLRVLIGLLWSVDQKSATR